MARNINYMSEWARNLVQKVRSEISKGTSIIGSTELNLGPRDGNNWELDQHYKDILKDKERRIDYEEKYRRLMGSAYGYGPGSSGKKFALEFQTGMYGKYTGPLSHEEIEAIKDITI